MENVKCGLLLGLIIPLVTGCVSDHSFDLLSGSSEKNPSIETSEDPVSNNSDNDAEQDADDRDDSDDGGLSKYSSRRSVFHKQVLSIELDVERNFKLEGTSPAQK